MQFVSFLAHDLRSRTASSKPKYQMGKRCFDKLIPRQARDDTGVKGVEPLHRLHGQRRGRVAAGNPCVNAGGIVAALFDAAPDVETGHQPYPTRSARSGDVSRCAPDHTRKAPICANNCKYGRFAHAESCRNSKCGRRNTKCGHRNTKCGHRNTKCGHRILTGHQPHADCVCPFSQGDRQTAAASVT